jgi:hypothetical protein
MNWLVIEASFDNRISNKYKGVGWLIGKGDRNIRIELDTVPLGSPQIPPPDLEKNSASHSEKPENVWVMV